MHGKSLVTLFFLATLSLLSAGLLSAAPAGASKPAAIPIRPGTALAKLVNEATPHIEALAIANERVKVDVPNWLRAHYMRNHSQLLSAIRPEDPTGGFPLALENLYVWMLHNQSLQPSPVPSSSPAGKVVSVGTNRRISGKQTAPRSESDIRTLFSDAKQIVAASNNIGNGRQAQFFSMDGGVTWGQTFLPLITGDSLHSDPTVDWTSDGTAWATTIGISAGSAVLQMRAYKSTDGGKSWTFDATFSGEQTSTDKQMMCVDHAQTSRFRDNIYVIWHNNAPAFVGRRSATGWQAPIQVSGPETTGTSIGSDITTNSSGDVFVVWPDTGSQTLFIAKSVDGAASFSKPTSIAKTFGSFQIRVPSFAGRAALIGASIASFRDTTRNDVYISWTDLSGGNNCNSPDSEPFDDTSSSCKSRIWVTRSVDGGVTWDQPQKVNDQTSLSDQFNQKLAVDPTTGVLGISYYDTSADNGRKKTDLVFQASVDKGEHWSPPVTTVTSAMTDETTGSADAGNQYGDYNGLSVVNGVFFPCWTDRRSNQSEEIFSARISVLKDAGGKAAVTFVDGTKSATPAKTSETRRRPGA